MTKAEQVFHKIASELPQVKETEILCAYAIKMEQGVTIALLWKDDMVFRLEGADKEEALQIEGATIFCPRGEERPINSGVLIPFEQSQHWKAYAQKAYNTYYRHE